jgi:hypothetical protein
MFSLAVGLFGIHYIDQINHWMGWKHSVDFKNVIENNKSKIYSNFMCSFFSSTYFSPVLDGLINEFEFTALKLRKIDNTPCSLEQTFVKRNKIFLDTIKLILNESTSYDFVLLTRYDLIFNEYPLLNADNTKVNLMCRAKWGNDEDLVDDNFYFMPYELLDEFYCVIKNIPITETSHNYHKYYQDFYFLDSSKSYYSHEIPTYNIIRG